MKVRLCLLGITLVLVLVAACNGPAPMQAWPPFEEGQYDRLPSVQDGQQWKASVQEGDWVEMEESDVQAQSRYHLIFFNPLSVQHMERHPHGYFLGYMMPCVTKGDQFTEEYLSPETLIRNTDGTYMLVSGRHFTVLRQKGQ